MTTTLKEFIVVLSDNKRPDYKSPDKLIGKMGREIKIILNVPKGFAIAIRTPTFIQCIDPDVIVTDICKDLIREDPFDYSYALQIISKEEKNSIQFILKCEVDNILQDSATPISMPSFLVNFHIDEYNMKSDYALKKIINSFQLPVENPQLFINGSPVEFNDQTTLDIINRLRFDKNENVFKCHLTDLALKMMQRRVNPMKELVSTEMGFLEKLNFLIHYFHPKMNDEDLVKDKGQLDRFIQCCVKIFKFHTKFLTSLTNTTIEYKTLISNCFFEMGDGFLISQDFIRQYGNFQSILSEVKTNEKLRRIENNVFSSEKNSFDQYTSIPFQRPVKYPLLLREIRKSTPSSHIDYFFLRIAESQMKSICSQIESYCDRIMNMAEMIKVANRIQDPEINVASNNHSLKSMYECKVRTQDEWNKKKPGMLYLYSDRVLCTKKNGLLTKVTETVIFYNKIKNQQFILSADQINSSVFFIVDMQNICDVIFESKEKRDDFLNNFRQIRQNLMILKPNEIYAEEIIPKDNDQIPPLPPLYDLSVVQIDDTTLYFSGGVDNRSREKCPPMIGLNSKSRTFSIDLQCTTPSPGMKMTSAKIVQNGQEAFVSRYLFGGFKTNSVLLFIDNHWEELPGKATFTRIGHSFVSYKNNLVVFGGVDENKNPSNEIYIYNVVEHKWSKPLCKHKRPPPRFDHSAVIYKNAMIVHGGQLGTEKLNDTWIFSFDQNEWAKIKLTKNNAIVPRSGHCAVMINQFMLVFGGEGFLNLPFALNIETLNVIDLKFKGNFIYGMNGGAASYIVDTNNLNEKQIICYGGFTNNKLIVINMFTKLYLPDSILNPDQIQSSENIKLEMNESHVKLLKFKNRNSLMMISNSSEFFVPPIDGDCFK